MKYQLRVPALLGDIIPLICVAETKAKRDATAGGTPFHKPCFDGRRRQHVDDLLDEARLGNLKVCNQLGSPRTVDEIIATENPVTVMRSVSEIDSNMTHICGLYATLKALNKWAEERGDEFTISSEPVEWVDERGVMGLTKATAVKGEAVPDKSPSGDDWILKGPAIANEIGMRLWNSGKQEITARNICNAVAIELAKDIKNHGNRGPRAPGSVRSVALKGWKFIPPSGTNGTSGTNE